MSNRLIITREWIDRQIANRLQLPINHLAVKAAADRTCEVNGFKSFPIVFEITMEAAGKDTVEIEINQVDKE